MGMIERMVSDDCQLIIAYRWVGPTQYSIWSTKPIIMITLIK